MSLETLIIYGSAAREDEDENSDVDLFGITSAAEYSMVVKQKINIAIQPMSQVINMALNGDLFLYHIIEEGKVLYDVNDNFEVMREKFKFRDSYLNDVSNASDLGWVLLRIAKQAENFSLINKRIAWCVRTILIAKCAEMRVPVFSASGLAEYAENYDVVDLIKNKNQEKFKKSIMKKFQNFLGRYAYPEPLWVESEIDYFEIEFHRTHNAVGLQTLRQLLSGGKNIGY